MLNSTTGSSGCQKHPREGQAPWASRSLLIRLSWSPAPASSCFCCPILHRSIPAGARQPDLSSWSSVFSTFYYHYLPSPTAVINTMDILYVCLCIVLISVPYMYKGYDSFTSWEPLLPLVENILLKEISLLPTDAIQWSLAVLQCILHEALRSSPRGV